jgi:hypothetical protein
MSAKQKYVLTMHANPFHKFYYAVSPEVFRQLGLPDGYTSALCPVFVAGYLKLKDIEELPERVVLELSDSPFTGSCEMPVRKYQRHELIDWRWQDVEFMYFYRVLLQPIAAMLEKLLKETSMRPLEGTDDYIVHFKITPL